MHYLIPNFNCETLETCSRLIPFKITCPKLKTCDDLIFILNSILYVISRVPNAKNNLHYNNTILCKPLIWDSNLKSYRINRFLPCWKILCKFWYDSVIPLPFQRVMACNIILHVKEWEGSAFPRDSLRLNGMKILAPLSNVDL